MAVKHEYQELKDIDTKYSSIYKTPAPVNVTVQEIHPHRRGASLSHYEASRNDWKTGVRERMPWWGIAAILLALACSVGSYLVLHFSNEVSAAKWPNYIAPNICLSILSSLSSIAITYAIGEGIAIAWWRCAMRGASVRELHSTWAFGASTTAIFTEFKFFNAVALASLMAKLSIVDGVLFQRATSTYIDIDWHSKSPVNIEAFSLESFPVTSVMGFDNDTGCYLTSPFGDAVKDWLTNGRQPLYDDTRGCDGVACEYFLPGAGFAFDCESTNITNKLLESRQSTINTTALDLFSIDLDLRQPDNAKNYSRLDLSMMFPATGASPDVTPACPTTFTQVTCELRPAVLNYSTWYIQPDNVEQSRLTEVLRAEEDVANGKPLSARGRRYAVGLSYPGSMLGASCLSIPGNWAGKEEFAVEGSENCLSYDPQTRQLRGTSVIRNKDIQEPWVVGGDSSLQGIHQILKSHLQSRATITHDANQWYVNTTGWLASSQSSGTIPTDGSCNVSFSNPTPYVLLEINTFTRQLSADATLYGTQSSRNLNTTGIQYFRDLNYVTDYKYAYAAMACTVLVVLCVLPAFYGFWQLGRDVTMGPLEIAYAFQGPAFTGITDTNGNVDTLVKAVGDTRIKYAEIHDGSATKIAFKLS